MVIPLLPAVLIAKKRDSHVLSEDEIAWFIKGFSEGSIADYQMSAMSMAILLNKMNPQEIAALTKAMLESGDRLQRSGDERPRVDKHSTGGLGDKVSLILAPLLACCGVQVPMISGRGLGLSGGTLDKLESIPGFCCDLVESQASQILADVGCHIIGANERIAPADRKLYALRDVTGTVESVALITASILSKKLAASLDCLVMDVKVGNGAFMKNLTDAETLASSLVSTGKAMGLPVTALLTDMDQPLGVAIGNANEVREAIDILQGNGPNEVRELTIDLCAELLVMSDVAGGRESAVSLLSDMLDSGVAMERFERMVASQDGDLSKLPSLESKVPVVAAAEGYLHSIDCMAIGECVVSLGGGRRKKDDPINPCVGVDAFVKVGDWICKGQELGCVYCSSADASLWAKRLAGAFGIDAEPVKRNSMVQMRIDP